MANGVNVAERYRDLARSGMSEAEIKAQADAELEQKRKADMSDARSRRAQSNLQDASTKAQLRNNMIKAVADSAVEAGTAIASSDKVQANVAANKEARLSQRADRMVGRNVDADKIEKVRTRAAESGFQAAQLNPVKYGQQASAYSNQGALYGRQPSVVGDSAGIQRAGGTNPQAANFQSQLMTNRTRSTPISSKQQYMKEANRLADLKARFGQ